MAPSLLRLLGKALRPARQAATPLPATPRPSRLVGGPELPRLLSGLSRLEETLREATASRSPRARGRNMQETPWVEASRLRETLEYSNGYLDDARVALRARWLLANMLRRPAGEAPRPAGRAPAQRPRSRPPDLPRGAQASPPRAT